MKNILTLTDLLLLNFIIILIIIIILFHYMSARVSFGFNIIETWISLCSLTLIFLLKSASGQTGYTFV